MSGHVETVEVATGGNPARALIAALNQARAGAFAPASQLHPGGVYRLSISHDDGCPCIDGKPMPACTCEVVTLTRERLR